MAAKKKQPKKPYDRIHSRKEWAARSPRGSAPLGVIREVVIHHTADPGPARNTLETERAYMRTIQNFHMDSRGWDDFAYHLAVMPSGRVYRGRPIDRIGAHVEHNNTGRVGIVVAGNFEGSRPTRAALASVAYLCKHHPKLKGKPVRGHRDFGGTSCPGKHLYPITKEL
jgi:N-acetylmuramoyl-L-alanine amidase